MGDTDDDRFAPPPEPVSPETDLELNAAAVSDVNARRENVTLAEDASDTEMTPGTTRIPYRPDAVEEEPPEEPAWMAGVGVFTKLLAILVATFACLLPAGARNRYSMDRLPLVAGTLVSATLIFTVTMFVTIGAFAAHKAAYGTGSSLTGMALWTGFRHGVSLRLDCVVA